MMANPQMPPSVAPIVVAWLDLTEPPPEPWAEGSFGNGGNGGRFGGRPSDPPPLMLPVGFVPMGAAVGRELADPVATDWTALVDTPGGRAMSDDLGGLVGCTGLLVGRGGFDVTTGGGGDGGAVVTATFGSIIK